jgi:hypothetical protein
MLYPLAAVALAAFGLTGLSLVLARVVPDRYDDLRPSRVRARRR